MTSGTASVAMVLPSVIVRVLVDPVRSDTDDTVLPETPHWDVASPALFTFSVNVMVMVEVVAVAAVNVGNRLSVIATLVTPTP